MFKHISAGAKRFWSALALLSVETIIVLFLLLVAFFGFAYITRSIFILHKTSFDQNVTIYLEHHVNTTNSNVLRFFTFLGTHIFLIPANLLLCAYFLFVKKHKWYSINFVVIALSSVGLMFLLKGAFARPRPDIPLFETAKGLSFPSGHALMSTTFYGLIIYIVFKTIETPIYKWTLIGLLIILIIVIGFSRIYLRVHYASDVLAGYCVGFLWLVFSVWILNKIRKRAERVEGLRS